MSWLMWLLAGSALLVTYSIYNGFRTRCPACGKYLLHRTDREAEAKQAEAYRNAQRVFGNSSPSFVSRPGYSTRNFRCSGCNHAFDRETAITWLGIANKLGEDVALTEYQKLTK
ncbi:MAG: hypothetical protein J0H86_09825 [Xanthomonadaceae bacterium]|nr:hypothetical protein [Xanthomonadaceae bacterium]